MRASLLSIAALCCVLFVACDGCGSNLPDPNNGGMNNSSTANGVPNNNVGTNNVNNVSNNNANNVGTNNMTTPLACDTNNFLGTVNFKRGRRYGNDVAQALALDEATLCRELGQFDCVDFVHRVALGDPEPYAAGMYEPLQVTTTSTTLVVERVVMAGCTQRVDADLADPGNAVIFAGIDAAAIDKDSPEVEAATTSLYRRALLRDPKDAEKAFVRDFYDEVVLSSPAQPGREWAVLSCFAVLTSTEAVFY